MRRILKLHRSLTQEIPNASHNFEITNFNQESHEEEWLALNNKIFANHPDQGNWTIADLHYRISQAWFDPEGFFVAINNNRIVGFCWTKIHNEFIDQDPIGEIYVLGVEPALQNLGLGRCLVMAGFNYLMQKSLTDVMLYTDAGNVDALRFYTNLGFC